MRNIAKLPSQHRRKLLQSTALGTSVAPPLVTDPPTDETTVRPDGINWRKLFRNIRKG